MNEQTSQQDSMEINNNEESSLYLDTDFADYQEIIRHLNIWEKMVFYYISIAKKNQLVQFFQISALKQIVRNSQSSSAHWYISQHRYLGRNFAQQLFILLKSATRLQPLLKEAIYNPDMGVAKVQKDPLPIEILFHVLHTNEDISSYPFIFERLSEGIGVENIADVQKNKIRKIQIYIEQMSDLDFQLIDDQYTNWISFAKLFKASHLDFLKRFDTTVSLQDDEAISTECTAVTIAAISHYIEDLFLAISAIDFGPQEVLTLIAFNQSLTAQGKDTEISDEEIRAVCEKIGTIIAFYKADKNLLQLLCISVKNPFLCVRGTVKNLTIKNVFKEIVRYRVAELSAGLVQDALGNEMKGVVEELEKSNRYTATGLGIYTKEIEEKIVAMGMKGFSYIYLIPLMKIFADNLNQWGRSFIGLLMVNVQFVDSTELIQLERQYKKMGKFLEVFDKFVSQVQKGSIVSVRIIKLLDAPHVSESEKQRLDVFIDSINSQSHVLVEEFKPMYTVVFRIMRALKHDIANNTKVYISNMGALKQIGGEDIEQRLDQLIDLCQKIKIMSDLTEQKQNTRKVE